MLQEIEKLLTHNNNRPDMLIVLLVERIQKEKSNTKQQEKQATGDKENDQLPGQTLLLSNFGVWWFVVYYMYSRTISLLHLSIILPHLSISLLHLFIIVPHLSIRLAHF